MREKLADAAKSTPRFRHRLARKELPSLRSVAALCACLWAFAANPSVLGATAGAGTITGTVLDPVANQPVEFAVVELRKAGNPSPLQKSVTDHRGRFTLENVVPGDYLVAIRLVGMEGQGSHPVSISATSRIVDLGRITIAEQAQVLDRFEVTAKKETYFNSIDRKVYNVGREIQSSSGTASDLLQNIPSVQVDVDGNVSLRGNENVLILVNGKPSPELSAKNRADALAQMSADAIDRIEVITNPSAKYKPDGTAGIINIVEKRQHEPGYSGALRVNVGNDRRANVGLTTNYHPGKLNLFGTFNLRQDERVRTSADLRQHLDTATDTFVLTSQNSTERMRPLTRVAQVGADYDLNDQDKVGAAISYNNRTFLRTSTITNLSEAAGGQVTSDYDRLRTDHEWQKTVGFSASYEHSFAGEGHDFKMELKRDRHWEQEDNHYTNLYRTPAIAPASDYTLIRPLEIGTAFTAEYVHPFLDGAKIEAGYSGEWERDDADFLGGFFDPVTGLPTVDVTRTNRFLYRDTIHALYATFERAWGHFGALAGLRAEETNVDTNQVTLAQRNHSSYGRLHPSLHLSYNLTETSQLQLNYSHRIHRPDGEDLNPFPEYQDPYNLREGNPNLRPEDTDSIEAGYQYHTETTSYLATLYYRETHNAFTTVSRYLDSTTLLTTQENLASNRSGGLELAGTAELGSRVTVNFSSNVFYNEVDASNLGYSNRRSAIAWNAKCNVDWHVTKFDFIQLSSNYRARQLTAQGERLPSFVTNFGVRHDFKRRNLAFVFSVADLFNTLKERTLIDTPVLHDNLTRRRSSRIFYVGLVYNFGKLGKKPKDDALKADDSL